MPRNEARPRPSQSQGGEAAKNQDQSTAINGYTLLKKAIRLDFSKPVESTEERRENGQVDRAGKAKRRPAEDGARIGKLLLLSMVDKANYKPEKGPLGGGFEYMSTFAKEAECSERTAQIHLRAMQSAGMVTLTPPPKGRKLANKFLLHPENWHQDAVAEYRRILPTLRKKRSGDSMESSSGDSMESGTGDSIESGLGVTQSSRGPGDSMESPRTTYENDLSSTTSFNDLIEHEPCPFPKKSARGDNGHQKDQDGLSRSRTTEKAVGRNGVAQSHHNSPERGDSMESPERDERFSSFIAAIRKRQNGVST